MKEIISGSAVVFLNQSWRNRIPGTANQLLFSLPFIFWPVIDTGIQIVEATLEH